MLEKISPHGSFQVTQLCESLAICEAMDGDPYDWGNATNTEPAFIVYLGCQTSEVAKYVEIFKDFYHCHCCEVRQPRHLKKFEVEIEIREMKRRSNSEGLGLDHLTESEEDKEFGCNYDEYNYYATGYLPRW